MNKNRTITFSIVIPMFNVETRLTQCVDSISAQTFRDFEALIFDDGSSDFSVPLCRRLIRGDQRFSLTLCGHSGCPAVLRNRGLKEAKNEYVLFVDADDTLEKEALEKLADAIERAGRPDLLSCRFRNVYEKNGGLIVESERFNMTESDGVIPGMSLLAKIANEKRQLACNGPLGVFKRAFMLEYLLFQNESLTLYEDNEWFPRVVFHAETVAACDFAYYNYIRSAGSVTTGLTRKSLESAAKASALMTMFYDRNKYRMSAPVRSFWCAHTFNALLWYFFNPMYSGRFSRADWIAAWNSESPAASPKLRKTMIEMLPYVSFAKRAAWPLLQMITSSGLVFPARLYFRILNLIRMAVKR